MEVLSKFNSNVTGGVTIPQMTHSQLQYYFNIPSTSPLFLGQRDKQYDWVVPYLATRFEILFQFVGETRIFNSWVNRSLEQYPGFCTWESFVSKVGGDINGQVKNFLVACRTLSSVPSADRVTVLIRGSRSSSGSGVWIWMLADHLSSRFKEITIDCYDITEASGNEGRKYVVGDEERVAMVTRIASFYEGDASEYDVVVDDAYDPSVETGTLPWSPASRFFSLKDHSAGARPYLHWVEGRVFSHPPLCEIVSPCPCVVCRSISAFSYDYSEFQRVKGFTVLLGGSPCLTLDSASALRAKGRVYKSLVLQTVASLIKPSDVRAALALSHSLNIVATSTSEIALRGTLVDRPLRANRVTGLEVGEVGTVCERLRGAHVIFVGVDPSVMGHTPTSQVGVPVYVSRSASLIFFRHEAPSSIWTCDAHVNGYVKTGYIHEYFTNFIRGEHHISIPRSEYSLHYGVPVEGDISWTAHVPGTYHISLNKISEGMRMVGWCPRGSYTLDLPFCMTSRGDAFKQCVSQHFDHVVDQSSPVVVAGLFPLLSCGGVFFVQSPGPICSYQPSTMTSVSCTHDHLLCKEGKWSILWSGVLTSYFVQDRSPIRVRLRPATKQALIDHFSHWRDESLLTYNDRDGQYYLHHKDDVPSFRVG